MMYERKYSRRWFWRNKQKQEIDLIHEADGIHTAYEIKWSNKKNVSCPSAFSSLYPEIKFSVITKENFIDFI